MTNSEVRSDYYTYALINPLKLSKESYIGGIALFDYEVFYFGYSGDEKRLYQHLACKKSDKNYHKKNTIKKIRRNGLDVLFVKLIENVVKRTAISKEIEMISYYGREDLGLGPLTNMTDGGEGGNIERIDISGQKFGRLIALKFIELDISGNSLWICKCECGNEKITRSSNLRNGKVKSCGCLNDEKRKETKTIHGMEGTAEYRAWQHMFQACNNPNVNNYKYYGGKGIIICEDWNKFISFYEDMGDKPSDKHVLDRMDKNGNFEPANCSWVDKSLLTINNEIKSIMDWSNISGTKYNTIHSRLFRNWSPKEAVFGK